MEWLDSEKIKNKLSKSALFLLSYELLNSSIIDGVKDFFISGFDENGFLYSDYYKEKVLPRAKHAYEASLIWLLEAHAISSDDFQVAITMRKYRNDVAHKIPDFVLSEESVSIENIKLVAVLVAKIDNFWANVEIDMGYDLDRGDVDREGATSLRSCILNYIISELIKE